MKDIIVIKGNQNGLSISMSNEASFEEVKQNLAEKLYQAKNFFGNNKVIIRFEGRKLSTDEADDLVDVIQKNTHLVILCVEMDFIDYDEKNIKILNELRTSLKDELYSDIRSEIQKELESNIEKEIKEKLKDNYREKIVKEVKESLKEDCGSFFYYNNLRSGQQIISDQSVIVLGNVNNGARIESGGSVIVLGKLKGVVHAGLKDERAVVIALEMRPLQIKIGHIIGKASDETIKGTHRIDPEVAFVEFDRIVIDALENHVFKEYHQPRKHN